MNFRQASNSRALASVTRVIASGSCSSILRSIWSSSFSQSLMARKARREPSARKSLTLKTESRAIRQPRTTRAVSSSPDKSSLRVSAGRVRASAGRDRAEVECRFGRAGGDGRFRVMGNSRNARRPGNYNAASIKRECERNVNVNVNERWCGRVEASLLLLLLLQRHGLLLSALGVLFSAESAIGAREQAQGYTVSRIRFGERFEIRQGAGKIGLLNLGFRQTQAPVTVVRINKQRRLELVGRVLRIFELQVNVAQQQPRGHLAGHELQTRFECIPRPGPIAGLLQRLAQFERGGGIIGTQFTSPLQVDSGFGEISGSEFKLAQLTERGRRIRVELQRLFQELARVTRSIIVAGQHGVVDRVLHFDFVFRIRQRFSGLGGVARRRQLSLPLSHFGLHALGFGTGAVGSVEILQLLRISLQVVELRPGSFDPLRVIGA